MDLTPQPSHPTPTPEQTSTFLEAVRSGSWEQVLALLARNPRVARATSASGETALMMAAVRGDARGVAALLPYSDAQAQTLPRAQNGRSNRSTALLFAAQYNHAHCVELLLPHSQPDTPDESGFTALMHAARHEDPTCAGVLSPFSDALRKDNSGRTALVHAVRWNRRATILLLAQVPIPPADREILQREAFRVALQNNQWTEAELFASWLPPALLRKELFANPNNFVSAQTLPHCFAALERLAVEQALRPSAEVRTARLPADGSAGPSPENGSAPLAAASARRL